MYENFSDEAKQVLSRSHDLALDNNEFIVGTEYLLLALFQEINSSCSILLKEDDVTEDKINKQIDDIVLFRKSIPGIVIYTQAVKQILENAIMLKKITLSNYVYEEHLFYSLLEYPNSIAQVILNKLNIDVSKLQNEILDVMDWEDVEEIQKDPAPSALDKFTFITNLTKTIQSKPLPPLVLRGEIIERIKNIINKKYKRNVLLIGNAGVGKTAIVEGLSKHFVDIKENKQIISLNTNSLISGTKYRGDFEKRIELFINEIKHKPEIILFIDEIHNIVNQTNLDAGMDLANIIKPALSRDEICCIGATTIDEYYRYLAKDSAFTRRFVNIFVDEPSLEDTMLILNEIKGHYEEFHQVSVSEKQSEYICTVSDKLITNNHFPDKAIDLLDEACSLCKNESKSSLSIEHINKIINQINNNKFNALIKNKLNHYPFLIRDFLKYYNVNKFTYKPISSILCKDMSEEDVNRFIADIQFIFNIKQEATKIIDLNNYTEAHSISNLLGAPPGYIGYDNENILSKFVKKYQKSLIIFKNLNDISIQLQNIIEQIIESGYIEDLSSNKVYFSNSIIIGTQNVTSKTIGYIDKTTQKRSVNRFKFKHLLTDVFNPLKKNEAIDYRVILNNYLSYLSQLNKNIEITNMEALESNTINDQTINSIEQVMCDLWSDETSNDSILITYDSNTKEFKID